MFLNAFNFFLSGIKTINGRAKRAPHWEILRDIYVGMYVGSHTYAKMRWQNYVEELGGQNTHMLKVSFGRLKPTCDTRTIHFDYTLEQL